MSDLEFVGRARIEQTTLLRRRVRFQDDEAWSGIPAGYRGLKGQEGTIVSVYLDREAASGPMYTVRLDDGLLIEAAGRHIRVLPEPS
jgi:hypothetical protein